MMAEHFDWKHSDDHRDLVHRAVQFLAEGKTVLFPTETAYVLAVSSENAGAIERLQSVGASMKSRPAVLLIGDPSESFDYSPTMSSLGTRLVQRCWPGPIAIGFPATGQVGPLAQLSGPAKKATMSEGSIRLRVPDHPLLLETLRLLSAPAVMIGDPAEIVSRTSADAVKTFGDHVDVVFDDGPTRYGRASTVIRLREGDFDVEHEGVVPEGRLRRLASEIITFVCTGNTCRSPMAEAIFKRMVADDLGCEVHELPEKGYTILSAGLAAMNGAGASSGAVEAVLEYNGNLDDHVSQGLTEELALYSDRLLVMTRDHWESIVRSWPHFEGKTTLLCGNRDVSDPVGGPPEKYRECAAQISKRLRQLLAEIRADRVNPAVS